MSVKTSGMGDFYLLNYAVFLALLLRCRILDTEPPIYFCYGLHLTSTEDVFATDDEIEIEGSENHVEGKPISYTFMQHSVQGCKHSDYWRF